MSLLVRAMAADDLAEVAKNETRAYAFPWTERMFADCLADPQFHCWVGEIERKLSAHTVISLGAEECHLLNLCIARDRQGQGYGRLLLQQVVDMATQLGARQMFLEVRPSNYTALSLYRSFGFSEIGLRKNYYPAHIGHEDALVFAMAL